MAAAGLFVMWEAQASELWMASTDPFGRGPDRPDVAQDYLDMFEPSAPWATVAKRLTVFKVGYSIVDRAPMEVLKKAFGDLRRRGIALAWEMGAIPPGTDCGSGEGYAGDTARSVARIKEAGGDLRFIAMDEPFWFGHHVDAKDSCKLSVTDLAAGVAKRLEIVRAVFPDVQVGDIEPVGSPGVDHYPDQLVEWSEAFRRTTGHRLAFLHADIDWDGPWRELIAALQARLGVLKIPVGIVVNGDPFAKTDVDWSNAALTHLQQAIDLAHLHPYAVIFQTWDDRPSKLLPEDQAGSLTNVVLEGSRPAANISVKAVGNGVTGRVTDEKGKAIDNAIVNITARDVNGLYGLHPARLTGTVPRNAVNGLFGLRIGLECACGGATDISIGELHFRDTRDSEFVEFLQKGLNPYSIHEKLSAQISVNTGTFAVVPGADYFVEIPINVREHPNSAGYVALFFLDANGKEIRRDPVQLKAAEYTIGSTLTNRKGEFSVDVRKGINPARLLVRIQVRSNGSIRSTVYELGPELNK